jgi:hypothetical protein
MRTKLLVAIAMAVALAGAVPGSARAEWDDAPPPGEYEQTLSPHGYWVDEPTFGRVWRPYTYWDWRPYYDGRWIWTSYGWTWSSYEPWGWTFHYGRWGYSGLYGWVWTPGFVWGPAWVDWYWGDGYVGWVPLGPIGFSILPSYWFYVRDSHFCSPYVYNHYVGHNHLPDYIVHHRQHGWGRSHAPHFRDIEHVSRHRIVRDHDRPRDSVAPWVRERLDRGEHVRERIADPVRGERVVEHRGKAPDRDARPGHAGRDGGGLDHRRDGRDRGGRPSSGDRGHDRSLGGRGREGDRPVHGRGGRPQVSNDGGWRRPTTPPVIEGDRYRGDAPHPSHVRPDPMDGYRGRPAPRFDRGREERGFTHRGVPEERSRPEPRAWNRPPGRSYPEPRGGRTFDRSRPAPSPQTGRAPSVQHAPQGGSSGWRGGGATTSPGGHGSGGGTTAGSGGGSHGSRGGGSAGSTGGHGFSR